MYFLHAFLITLIKKYVFLNSHMFKKYMSFLYVGGKKFLTNWFVENFYPLYEWLVIKIINIKEYL
jgi:hypothetical protein